MLTLDGASEVIKQEHILNAKTVVVTTIYIADKAKDLLVFLELVMEAIIILQVAMTKAETKSELSFHDHSFIKE